YDISAAILFKNEPGWKCGRPFLAIKSVTYDAIFGQWKFCGVCGVEECTVRSIAVVPNGASVFYLKFKNFWVCGNRSVCVQNISGISIEGNCVIAGHFQGNDCEKPDFFLFG